MSSINGLTVICEKHKVPITNSANDGVQVLDFAFQQDHSGTVFAVLVRMVQHHVEKITEFGSDTGIMYVKEERRQDLSTHFRAMIIMYFVQQSHYFFAQAKRSGVAGRWRTVGQPHTAEETHDRSDSQPHFGYSGCWSG